MANIERSEQEILRRESLAKIKELGIDPYPAALYPVNETARGIARCKTDAVTEPLRRQILRQSFYRAALHFLDAPPSWGALSGVRPTKLVSRHLIAGGNRASADRMLRERAAWTAGQALYRVACQACEEHREKRYPTYADFLAAWRQAAGETWP